MVSVGHVGPENGDQKMKLETITIEEAATRHPDAEIIDTFCDVLDGVEVSVIYVYETRAIMDAETIPGSDEVARYIQAQ